MQSFEQPTIEELSEMKRQQAAKLIETQKNQDSFGLTRIDPRNIPDRHPVNMFREVYESLVEGFLLPHENSLLSHPDMQPILPWVKHIEPIEINGGVDFRVLTQGEKVKIRERRYYQDVWMSQTLDPEFAEARYKEIIGASILRKPMYSRGSTPTRERSYIFLIRGIFPLFADTQHRMRLFTISAEPYVIV